MASWVVWHAVFCRNGRRKEVSKRFHDEDYSVKVDKIVESFRKRGYFLHAQKFDIKFSDVASLIADD